MKKLLIILLIIGVLITGCGSKQETYSNGVPNYFIEPEGYIIADIDCVGFLEGGYGYISESDYQKYLDGDLKGALKILNPYEKGKSISIKVSRITSIETGDYEDYRDYMN